MTAPEWERVIRADAARAKQTRENVHPCSVCKRSMIAWPGRMKHWSCEPNSLIGKVCNCPPGCSVSRYGDGPSQCAASCEVCKMMRGQALPRKGR